MANEKTRLLDTCVVTIPKQIYFEDEENNNFSILSHEQLLAFVDDPYWRNVRTLTFFTLLIILIAMFTVACLIATFEYGACSSPKIKVTDTFGILSQASNQSVILQRLTQIF